MTDSHDNSTSEVCASSRVADMLPPISSPGAVATPTPLPSGESASPTESWMLKLALVILPVLIGSLIGGLLVEGFKDDSALKVDLVEKAYAPLLQASAACEATHNQLFLNYGKLAGTHMLIGQELHSQLASNIAFANVGQGDALFGENLAKTASQLIDADTDGTVKVQSCRTDIYQRYEQFALMTGMYEEFKNSADRHNGKINVIYADRHKRINAALHGLDERKFLDLIRSLYAATAGDGGPSPADLQKIDKLFPQLVEFDQIMASTETELFNEQEAFLLEQHEAVAREISSRFHRGWLRRFIDAVF